jgi:S-adenosylhomocysteine hydrolase
VDFDAIVSRYLEKFPDEAEGLSELLGFLRQTPGSAKRVSRTNFTAHMSASCLLVDPLKRQILLFRHPRYKALLQPGGHYESPEESPVVAATRKLFDETTFTKAQVQYLPYDFDPLIPIDVDTHPIPEDNSKQEPPHFHHDFRYVFITTAREGIREIPARPTEGGSSYEYVWQDFARLNQLKTFERLSRKLHKFLSITDARRRFFVRLAQDFKVSEKVSTIIVTHILPDSFEFLDTLSRSTNLIGIIPKPNSINEEAKQRLLSQNLPVLELTRESIPKELPGLLERAAGKKVVLLDIGGWFVPALRDLPEGPARAIAGIVEDTRNGLDKYEALAKAQAFRFPVISVAESDLKASEDLQVGKSIVFSADAILRDCDSLVEYMECGVVGYGKIGRSIAYHLQQRGIRPYVVEKDPLRRLEAFRNMCSVRHRDWVNRNVDALFCATGKQATGIIDFRTLKPGAFVFSVTSPDDEFEQSIPTEFKRSRLNEHVDRYDGPHNHFHLVNDGKAVNFIHGAFLGEFIQLVKGGIFIAMRNIADGRPVRQIHSEKAAAENGPGFCQLFELDREDQSDVAKLWMETVLLGVNLEE